VANNRANIRAAIKTVLDGATSAGSNVYSSRRTKLWNEELPAIFIFTLEEPVTPESQRNTRYIRDVQILIEIRLEASTDVDDELDALVGEVEDLIIANQSLSGTVLSVLQLNTEVSFDPNGEKEVGVAILTYQCKYIS
jgi:hypothetical protein